MSNIKVIVDAKFRAMWAGGAPSKKMAERYGCKYPAINSAAKAAGLASRSGAVVRSAKGGGGQMPSRADDCVLLDMVRRRSAGEHPREIAPDRFDRCAEVTNSVRREDIRLSGEPEAMVRGAYW